jgi:hypothetical protein
VGTHTHRGVVIDHQFTQMVVEVSIRMKWARVNEVSSMITTTSNLIAPVTDRSMMDTQDGTYVWEYSQEDFPESILQLYLGNVKVLTNSSWRAGHRGRQQERPGSRPRADRIVPALWQGSHEDPHQ